MKGLILVSMLAVALGCLATADAQQPTPAQQPQTVLVPPVVVVPQSRVVCRNGICAPVAAPAPGSGYQFTRGFFPWRVRYSAWSR